MVKCEFFKTREDGVDLYRTYSDRGLKIQKVGTAEIYDEAIDVDGAGYEYVETDVPIGEVIDSDEATETDLLNALAELGVTDDEESNA